MPQPRKVTQEAIDALEKLYPLYRGIGKVMVEEGLWIVVERREKRCQTN